MNIWNPKENPKSYCLKDNIFNKQYKIINKSSGYIRTDIHNNNYLVLTFNSEYFNTIALLLRCANRYPNKYFKNLDSLFNYVKLNVLNVTIDKPIKFYCSELKTYSSSNKKLL